MKPITGMKPINSTAGYTAVNPKYAFSNTKVLSAVAQTTKVSLPEIRTTIKATPATAIPSTQANKPTVPRLSPLSTAPVLPARQDVSPLVIPTTRVQPSLSGSAAPPRVMSLPSVSSGFPTPLSSIASTDRRIFGSGSFLTAFGSTLGESTIGQILRDDSKCKIVAILSENILEGYPKSNLLVIKKSESPTVQPQTYTILRKSLFRDTEYSKLVELRASDVSFKQEYAYILEDLGFTDKQVFTIRDNHIEKDMSYIYKVQLSWTLKFDLNNSQNAQADTTVSTTISSVVDTIRAR